MNSRCFQWMLDLAVRLSVHPQYGSLPVITEFPANRTTDNVWAQTVEKTTAAICGSVNTPTKAGMAVFINCAHTEREPDTLGGIRTFLVTEITIMESPTYNLRKNTGFGVVNGFHSDDAAEAFALHLENWRDYGIADAARVEAILTQHPGWLPEEVREKIRTKTDLIESAFQVRALWSGTLPQRWYPPAIGFAGGNFTLAGPAGASFYYTLDGSMPSVKSTHYSGATAAPTGAIIRAVSTGGSLVDSDPAYSVAP